MTRGQYLRTNYRTTGGILDITAIGGGYPTAAAQGGAGNPSPYGGFIYITSYSTSFGSTTTLTLANWLVDSTYGVLSWFFTSLSPGSGYKFVPLGYRFRSVSDTKIGAAAALFELAREPIFASITFSSSIFGLLFRKPTFTGGTGSLGTLVSYSGQETLLDLWGFIVSSP